MNGIQKLETVTELTRENLGGKAFHLLELIKAGFTIPQTYVMTIEEYRNHISNWGLQTKIEKLLSLKGSKDKFNSILTEIHDSILQGSLDSHINEEITKILTQTDGDTAFAVRSSGNLEDTDNWSFAGQYDTYLNLKSEYDIAEAIKKCWASIWQEHLFAYLENANSDSLPEMGLVIQKMVSSEVSGVLFTLNPQTGNENHMLIESAWGLGEGVVSGIVNPDRFVVGWNGKEIIEQVISNKKAMVIMDPSGLTQPVETSSDIATKSSLTEEQINELVDLGISIAKYYGKPQDVEFGIENDTFYLLQTRSITSFQFDPKIGQWTNANFVEVFPGFHNPLSFSLTGKAFTDTIQEFFIKTKIWRKAPPKDQREIWHKFFFGRCYWQVSAVKDLLVQIPGFNERSFDHTTGVDSQYEGDGRTTGWTPGRIIWGIPVLLALEKEYKNFSSEVDAYNKSYFEKEPQLFEKTKQLQSMDDKTLQSYIRELFDLDLLTNYFAQYISFLGAQAQDDFHVFLGNINKKRPIEKQIVSGNLFTGLKDIKTSYPLLDLNQLAETVMKDPAMSDYVLNMDPQQIIAALDENSHQFSQLFKDYIEKYFWMAPVDEDLSSTRWKQDPMFPLTLLREALEHKTSAQHTIDHQVEVRMKEEEHAKQVLSSGLGKINIFRKKSFWKQVENVRKHIWWREEARVVLARSYYFVNQATTELAERWVNGGIIQEKQELYYLTFEEILDFFETGDRAEVTSLIASYLSMKAMYTNFNPPSTIGGHFQAKQALKVTESSLQGVGCSPGIVKGKVTVITSLDQASEVSQGDILVVPFTNPGWTPIFSIISGIIMEEGGLLSHGAVVAREYGIPAILQIEDIIHLLKTGDEIEMDGTQGIVTIIKQS